MPDARFARSPKIDADVNLLVGQYRDLMQDGRLILHEEIENLVGLKRRTSRYQTITRRWRQIMMDEQHIVLSGRWALGAGFKSLTPDDMVRDNSRRVRALGRAIKRVIHQNAIPQPGQLTDNKARLFHAKLSVLLEQMATTHRRGIVDLSRSLLPMRQLPRASGE